MRRCVSVRVFEVISMSLLIVGAIELNKWHGTYPTQP